MWSKELNWVIGKVGKRFRYFESSIRDSTPVCANKIIYHKTRHEPINESDNEKSKTFKNGKFLSHRISAE